MTTPWVTIPAARPPKSEDAREAPLARVSSFLRPLAQAVAM